jgi:hypothetical protein
VGSAPLRVSASHPICALDRIWLRANAAGARGRLTGMNTPKPTEVCITIDTEFSIGGNFEDPGLMPIAEPVVLGPVAGKEQALGFLLDSFAEFGVRATFFVEALQTAYFGDEPMGTIARRIAQAGHDVQLHLHPCWLHYQTAAPLAAQSAPDDSCAGRTDAELDHFFKFGLSVFSRWGLPAPIAVRTGNFQVDKNLFRAAGRAGFRLSSTIAVPIWRPADEHLALFGGKHRIGQLLELPVFCYCYRVGGRERLRPLCITACSSAEIIYVLQMARRHLLSPVVILTHPQEFIKKTDFRYSALRRNRVNQTRLRKLLEFLRRNQNDFIAVPITEVSDDAEDVRSFGPPAVSVSAGMVMARMLENGVNDRIWRY